MLIGSKKIFESKNYIIGCMCLEGKGYKLKVLGMNSYPVHEFINVLLELLNTFFFWGKDTVAFGKMQRVMT